jgi:outer membrane protein insertion porin family
VKLARVSKTLLAALAVLFGLIVLGALVLSAPIGERFATRRLERALETGTGGAVTVDRLELEPWRLAGRATGFHLRRESPAADLVYSLDAAVARVSIDRSGRLRIVLESPELAIALRRDPPPRAPTGPSIGERLERARVGRVAVEGGVLRLLDEEGAEALRLDRVALALARADRNRFAAEGAAAVGVRAAAERWLDAGALTVTGEIAGPEIQLRSAHLERPGADLDARGTLRESPDVDGALEADFRLSTAVVRELFPELRATGELDGTARLALDASGLSIEADFRGAGLHWDEIGPFAADGRLRLADRRLELVGGSLAGYGGRADVDASWELEQDRQSVAIEWTGVDLGALAEDLDPDLRLPAEARVSGEGGFATEGFALDALTGGASVRAEGRVRRSGAPVAASAQARVGDGIVTIESGTLEAGGARLDAAGRVTTGGELDGSYRLRVGDLARAGEMAAMLGAPAPPVDLAGTLEARGGVSGTLADPRWTASVERQSVAVAGRPAALDADARGDERSADVRRLTAEIGGGSIHVDGRVSWRGVTTLALRLEVDGVDLCSLDARGRAPACGVLDAGGELAGTLDDPRWSLAGEVSQLRARRGSLAPDSDATASLPAPGLLRFRARQQDGRVVIDELRGLLEGGAVEGTGSYDLAARELDGELRIVDLPLVSVLPAGEGWSSLRGLLDVVIELDGPLETPRGQALATLRELRFEDQPLPDVEMVLEAGGAGDLELQAKAGGPEPFLIGRVELEPPYPLQADLFLGAIPRQAVVDLLHRLPYRVSNPLLDGRVAIDAALEPPVELHVRGEVERLEADYGRLRLAAEPFTVAGDREGLRIEGLLLQSGGAALLVSGTLPLGAGRELDLRADGELPLELLATPELALDGTADLDVAITGRWRSPYVSGSARVVDASGRFGNIDWQQVSIEARLAGRQILIDASAGRLLGGTFSGRGEMTIEEPIEESDVELALDVEGIDLVRLARELPTSPRPYLVLDAEVTLAASRLEVGQLGGWVDLIDVRAGADGNEMASLEPTRIVVEGGRATLPELHLTGGGTDLRLEGATTLERPLEDMAARVIGNLDLAQLGFLATSLPGLEFAGLGSIDLEMRHGADGLELRGGGAITGGRMASRRPRFVLTDIAGDVAFRGSAIRLRQLQGRLGGGSVVAHASIDLDDLTRLESVVLEAEATEVNLTFGDGVRARFSGDALFQGRDDRYRLKGDLRILSGLFTREIDAATSEREFLAGVRTELAEEETAPFAETVELGLRLASQGDVFVDNALTRVTAGGNLRVEGTLAQPEITGLVTNTADGILRLGRNVFNLELARIALDSYPLEPPYVEVAATTETAGYTVRLELEGTPDDVETTLTSTDPGLTQGDLAALLTTGRTAESAPEGATALLEAQAATYLGELFQEQLGLGLVFDTPATLPVLSSETGPEDRFSVGRRLTDELTVAYSVGVEDDESLWILDYQPLRRLWFRVIEESGEAYTFEVAQRLTFDRRGATPPREPTRVASVEVTPADPKYPPPPLERRLKVKPGQRYDYWRAEDAGEEIRRELVRAGFLGARVDVESETADGGDVALRFVVDPGAQVSFRWTGDDPGKKLKENTERGWGSHLPAGLLVADLAARATHELQADRWYQARVFGSFSDAGAATRTVELEVRLGPRGKGVDLDFVGNETVSDAALQAVLPEPDDQRFFAWISEDPGRVEDAIALRYAEAGFLDVRVGDIDTVFDPESQRLRVTVPVDEGLRYTVEAISFPGADSLPLDTLERSLPITVGEPFSLSDYREAGRWLRRFYRGQGFPDASVRTRVRRLEPGALELLLYVDEGDPAVLGHIEITGHSRTHEDLIRRQLHLETGDPLRVDQLAAAERELYRLGVFRSVEVVAQDPRPGSPVRDVVVRVVEKPLLSFDYGLRYRSDDVETLQPTVDEVRTKGLEAVARTQILQPFHRADSLIFSLFAGEERRRGRLGWQIPHFFGRRLPTEVSIEAGKEARERLDIEVRARSGQFTLQQRRRLGEHTRLLYGVQLQRGRVDEVIGAEAPQSGVWVDHNRLTTSMVHDRRDDVMNPRRGMLFSGTVQAGSPAIGADTEFVRLNGQWSLFVPLGRGERAPVWASSYRTGAIWSADPFTDPFLDLEDRFTAGGPFSVRGFDANTLGPRFPDQDGFPIGGRGVVILNQELRFPIWDALWGGVFYDVGNVFARPEDIDLDALRESFGVGLRYDIGFGVLRLDVGRVRDRLEGEASERLHLSFGHAF